MDTLLENLKKELYQVHNWDFVVIEERTRAGMSSFGLLVKQKWY